METDLDYYSWGHVFQISRKSSDFQGTLDCQYPVLLLDHVFHEFSKTVGKENVQQAPSKVVSIIDHHPHSPTWKSIQGRVDSKALKLPMRRGGTT